jgi:hypothetical protein
MKKEIDLLNPETNEVVKEVREIRYRISEKYGHDINRLLAHYQEVEERLRKTGKYKFVDPEPFREKLKATKSSDDKAAD